MNNQPVSPSRGVRRFLTTSILAVCAPPLSAATWTWQGGTGNWSDTAQWLDDLLAATAPVSASTTDLIFNGSDPVQYVATNDFGFFTLNSLTLASTSTLGQTIAGGTLSFAADGGSAPLVLQNGTGSVTIGSFIDAGTALTFGGTGTGTTTLSGAISGSGGLTFSGAKWVLSNTANSFTGGLTVLSGATVELAPGGGGNQAVNITPAATGIAGGNAGANAITINGGTLKFTTSGTGNMTFGDNRALTFGTNGGTLDLRNNNLNTPGTQGGGMAGGNNDLALTLSNTAANTAVIQFSGGELGLSANSATSGDWSTGNNTLRIESYAGTGALRIELTNGAMFNNRAATINVPVTVRGVVGADPTSGPLATVNANLSRTTGRHVLDVQSVHNYALGLTFEGAVQVAVAGAARAIDGNVTIAGSAGGNAGYVTFSGRGTGTAMGAAINNPGTNTAGQNVLWLGQAGNDTLTIRNGGIAVLDARIRHDQANNNAVLLNASAIIEGGGELRIAQSLSRATAAAFAQGNSTTSTAGTHIIDGDIRGQGTTANDAVLNIMLPFPSGNDTNADQVPDDAFGDFGGVVFRNNSTATSAGTNGADLVVNGSGFGGLRISGSARPNNLFSPAGPDPVSNVAKVNNLVTPARIAGLTGSGGYLSIAPAGELYTFPNAEWAGGVTVGLKVVDHATGADVQFDPAKTSWAHHLAVETGAELALGAAPFSLTAGTLAGNGAVTGAGGLTVASGAGIAPGFSIGTLTVADLVLDGTLFIETTDTPTNDLLQVNGALTLGATSVLSLDPANTVHNGIYTIVSYTGIRTGTFAALQNIPLGYDVNYDTPGQIRLVFSAIQNRVWNGTPGNQWSTNAGDANWQGPAAFGNGNIVAFDDTAAGTTTVVLNGTVAPALMTFNNVTKSYIIDGSAGAISGGGDLELNGAGAVELRGTHTYGGTTKINAGTLLLGNSNVLPDAGAVTIAAAGELDLAGRTDTIGDLTTAGNITAGSLSIGSLSLTGSPAVLANLTLGGNVAKTGAGTAAIGGSVNLGGATRTFDIESGGAPDLSIGAITNGGLTKAGAGEMVLAATSSYAGGTTVSAGTLRAGVAGALPSGAFTVNGGTLDLNSFDTTATSLNGAGGTIAMGTASLIIDTPANGSFAGAITGIGGIVVKLGAGAQTLAGGSTFSGGLIIDAGRVNLTNTASAGTGTISLNPGATLQIGAALPNNITIDAGTISSQTGANVGTGEWTVQTSLAVHTYNEDTLGNSEVIFEGTLRGLGSIDILKNPTQGNADNGPGLRLRGTAFSDYSGTLTIGERGKFEVQMANSASFNPFGTGTMVMTGGTSTGGLNGTYSLFQPRMNTGSQTYPLANDVVVSGPGYVNFNLLGAAGAVAQMGNLTIGDGQVLGSSKNSDVELSVEFPTVTLTGGIAEFRAYDPAFGVQTNAARGGGHILLGAISEDVPGAGIIFKSGTSAARTHFNEVHGIASFTGPTDIETGILQIDLLGSLASSSQIEISTGAKLDVSEHLTGYEIPTAQRLVGSGDWDGRVSLRGTLAPGESVGSITGDDFTFNGGATMEFELSSLDNTSDLLSLTGNFTKGVAGSYLFDFEGGGLSGETYTLVQFAFTDFAAFDFSYTDLAPGLSGTFIQNTNDLQFTVVPEPGGACALLAGLGVLLSIRRRR